MAALTTRGDASPRAGGGRSPGWPLQSEVLLGYCGLGLGSDDVADVAVAAVGRVQALAAIAELDEFLLEGCQFGHATPDLGEPVVDEVRDVVAGDHAPVAQVENTADLDEGEPGRCAVRMKPTLATAWSSYAR